MIQAQDTLIIDRLDYRFISYENGIIAPLVSLEESQVGGVFLSCDENFQVEFCGPKPFDVWVDGRLLVRKASERCLYLTTEDICQVIKRDTAYLTVVSAHGLSGVTVHSFSIVESKAESSIDFLKRNPVSGFWYLGFLACCILLVSLKSINPIKGERILRPNFNEFSGRFMTIDHLVLLVFLTTINALCWSYVWKANSTSSFFNSFSILLLLWMVKWILNSVSGAIFKFPRQASWQMVSLLLFWMIFSILIFLLLFADLVFLRESIITPSIILNIIPIGMCVFVLAESFILISQKGIKSLHLFIYLCTTEILPTSLLIYWFFK